ncbi:hypothetical protein ACK3TF_005322 [Chlorella vulgaris]
MRADTASRYREVAAPPRNSKAPGTAATPRKHQAAWSASSGASTRVRSSAAPATSSGATTFAGSRAAPQSRFARQHSLLPPRGTGGYGGTRRKAEAWAPESSPWILTWTRGRGQDKPTAAAWRREGKAQRVCLRRHATKTYKCVREQPGECKRNIVTKDASRHSIKIQGSGSAAPCAGSSEAPASRAAGHAGNSKAPGTAATPRKHQAAWSASSGASTRVRSSAAPATSSGATTFAGSRAAPQSRFARQHSLLPPRGRHGGPDG